MMYRRWLLIVGIALILPTTASGEARFSEGFRGIPWGTPKQEAEAKLRKSLGEPLKLGDAGEFRPYVDTLGTTAVWISRLYYKDSLYLVMVSNSALNRSKNLVRFDTKQIAAGLTEKYGDPAVDSTYENEEGSLVVWLMKWATAESDIKLFATQASDADMASFSITYTCRELGIAYGKNEAVELKDKL